MRKVLVALTFVSLLALGVTGMHPRTDGAARAAVGEQANCVAVLTSFYGSQTEVDNAVHTLQATAAEGGMTFGEIAGILVRENGTVNECLAVLGLPPVQP